MQKLNSIIAILALAAATYLLIDKFSASDDETEKVEEKQEAPEAKEESLGKGKIAHINIDSINANFAYLEDKLKVLQDEQSRSERRMSNKLRKAEEEYMKLQEDAKYMTPSQMQEAEQTIQQSQMDLQAYQERLANDLMKLESGIQEDLNERIMEVVEDVNNVYGYDYILAKSTGGGILVGNESSDLTNEVLEELNARYAAELAAEKTGEK